MNIRSFLGVGLTVLLTACAQSASGLIPTASNSGIRPADTASMAGSAATGLPGGSAATGLPGGSAATGLPGGSAATGLPGGSAATGLPGSLGGIALPGGSAATGLPGGSAATGLPGAQLLCNLTSTPGQASCTIAVNLNVAVNTIAMTPGALLAGLHPSDLQNAYRLPSQNAGGVVAVVDAYDDPTAEADLAIYRTVYGLPECTSLNGCFRKVNQSGQTGGYPAPNLAWGEEIALDLDMISAACPHCKILLVEANSALLDDLGAGVDTAAAMGATAISNSYYAVEWSGETSEDVHYQHPGIAITASSGDQAAPFYPAASQYVTAVGGTTLSGSAGAWHETPWSYGGQGCSAYVERPQWQRQTSCKTRASVDVAAVADPQTGVSMYDSLAGGWLVAGGTSIGAPLVASAYALSNNPAGPAYSYDNSWAFNHIGTWGYDLGTGLGSPKGVAGF